MLMYVLLFINIIVLGTVSFLLVRNRQLNETSLEINELSRRINDLASSGYEFESTVNEHIFHITEYLEDIDSRINIVISTSNALRDNHNLVTEQTNTILTISEEVSNEIFSIKKAMVDFEQQVKEIDEYVLSLGEGSSMIEQGFLATVSSITQLQEAQKVTRDLLDATIDSFDWDDDDSLPDVNENVLETDNVDNPTPIDQPTTVNIKNVPTLDDEPPLVEPRKDGDPLITDLRAVPFEESYTGGPDPYALGFTPDVEEWPTDFSTSGKSSTSRSKSRSIRRLR